MCSFASFFQCTSLNLLADCHWIRTLHHKVTPRQNKTKLQTLVHLKIMTNSGYPKRNLEIKHPLQAVTRHANLQDFQLAQKIEILARRIRNSLRPLRSQQPLFLHTPQRRHFSRSFFLSSSPPLNKSSCYIICIFIVCSLLIFSSLPLFSQTILNISFGDWKHFQ
jgi:hypothetical protein